MGNMTRRRFVAVAGTTAAALGAGCVGESGPATGDEGTQSGGASEETTPAPTPAPTDAPATSQYIAQGGGVAILSWEWTQDDFSTALNGIAKNTTDSAFEYVQIEFSFVNAQDTQLATGLANTNNLEAGQKWRWSTPYMGDDPDGVDSISVEFSAY